MKIFAQEPADALRYSWFTQSGTARSQAAGGAMVSLGGDLTALFVNPAGLGFFKTGEFLLTPAFSFQNNKANYLDQTEKARDNQFNFGASGLILPMGGNRKGNWRNFTFGLGVNRVANFNNRVELNGLNNQSSYSEKYLEDVKKNILMKRIGKVDDLTGIIKLLISDESSYITGQTFLVDGGMLM